MFQDIIGIYDSEFNEYITDEWHKEDQHRGYVQNPFQVIKCPATNVSYYSYGVKIGNIKFIAIDKSGTFVGIDYSGYLFYGGGIKYGIKFK